MPRDLQHFLSDPARPAFFESVPFEFGADLGRFTLDRLMKILAALDGRIRVTVHVDSRRTEVAAAPLPG